MFEFKEPAEEPAPRRGWPRVAALSGAFLAMVGLALAALLVLGFALFWTVRAIQD